MTHLEISYRKLYILEPPRHLDNCASYHEPHPLTAVADLNNFRSIADNIIQLQNVTIMQALWSRAGQIRSCRCSSCLHDATTLARRTTTAASKRRLRVSDVFTAFYSSVFATAALADARVKENRRRQWDTAIAEVRGTTPQLDQESLFQTQTEETAEASNIESPWAPFDQSGRTVRTATFTPRWDGSREFGAPGTDFAIRLSKLGSEIDQSHAESVDKNAQEFGDVLMNEGLEEDDGGLPDYAPDKSEHLVASARSITIMVEKFILKIVDSIQQRVSGSTQRKLQPELKDMILRIQKLRGGFTTLPAYEWRGYEAVYQGRGELHQLLQKLCDDATPQDASSIELMLAKICINLLVSTAPPSVTLYNLLLRELTRLRQHDLAQIVVDSFFYDPVYKVHRPNRITIELLFTHFEIQRDAHGWRNILERIRHATLHPAHTLLTRRRHIDEMGTKDHQEWAANNILIRRKNFLIHRSPRDVKIYDALIRGAILFNPSSNAIRYIRQSLRESQVVYTETLCSVIERCLEEKDVRRCMRLLRNIVQHLWNPNTESSAFTFTRGLRYYLYQLLHICGLRTTLEPPENVLGYVAQMVQTLLRQMHRAAVEDAVVEGEDYIETLEAHLEANRYQHMVISDYGEMAAGSTQDSHQLSTLSEDRSESADLQIGWPEEVNSYECSGEKQSLTWLSKRVERAVWKRRVNERTGRLRRLEFLDAELSIVSRRLAAIEMKLIPVAFHAVHRHTQLMYLRRMPKPWSAYCHVGRLADLVALLRRHDKFARLNAALGFVKTELNNVENKLFKLFPKAHLSITTVERMYIKAARGTDKLGQQVKSLYNKHARRIRRKEPYKKMAARLLREKQRSMTKQRGVLGEVGALKAVPRPKTIRMTRNAAAKPKALMERQQHVESETRSKSLFSIVEREVNESSSSIIKLYHQCLFLLEWQAYNTRNEIGRLHLESKQAEKASRLDDNVQPRLVETQTSDCAEMSTSLVRNQRLQHQYQHWLMDQANITRAKIEELTEASIEIRAKMCGQSVGICRLEYFVRQNEWDFLSFGKQYTSWLQQQPAALKLHILAMPYLNKRKRFGHLRVFGRQTQIDLEKISQDLLKTKVIPLRPTKSKSKPKTSTSKPKTSTSKPKTSTSKPKTSKSKAKTSKSKFRRTETSKITSRHPQLHQGSQKLESLALIVRE